MNPWIKKHPAVMTLMTVSAGLLLTITWVAQQDFAAIHGAVLESTITEAGTSTPDDDAATDAATAPRQTHSQAQVPSAGDNGVIQAANASDPSPGNSSVSDLQSGSSQSSPRPSPEPSPYPGLSRDVLTVLEQVQQWQLEENQDKALAALNELYTEFDSLNSFEQQTVLNFYTNTLLSLEMWQEAISAFSMLLTVDDLNSTTYQRTLRSLGQLHGATGDRQAAITYLELWMQETEDDPEAATQRQTVARQLDLFKSANVRQL